MSWVILCSFYDLNYYLSVGGTQKVHYLLNPPPERFRILYTNVSWMSHNNLKFNVSQTTFSSLSQLIFFQMALFQDNHHLTSTSSSMLKVIYNFHLFTLYTTSLFGQFGLICKSQNISFNSNLTPFINHIIDHHLLSKCNVDLILPFLLYYLFQASRRACNTWFSSHILPSPTEKQISPAVHLSAFLLFLSSSVCVHACMRMCMHKRIWEKSMYAYVHICAGMRSHVCM